MRVSVFETYLGFGTTFADYLSFESYKEGFVI